MTTDIRTDEIIADPAEQHRISFKEIRVIDPVTHHSIMMIDIQIDDIDEDGDNDCSTR